MMPDDAQLACLEVRGGNVPADVELAVPGLSIHVLSRPYQSAAAGGDVHYVSSCGTGRITRLMLADVAGHGDAVGALARVLHDLMRRYVNQINPRHFVERMNEEFSRLTDAGVFATAVVATYFAPTRRLTLINAGHPPPLLYRAADQTWSVLDEGEHDHAPRNIPLGILDGTAYDGFEIDLHPGDAVACYTDSLPESRDAAGELIGYERLLALARALGDGEKLGDWLSHWLTSIDAVSPGNLLGDDLTVLLLQATAGPTQAALPARAAGIGRMFAAPFRGQGMSWPEFDVRNLGGSIFPWLSQVRRKK